MNTNTVQPIEFLYTWYQDYDNWADVGRWYAHIITKRTPKLVFVQYKIGGYLSHYPGVENLRLSRAELEEKGEVSWVNGTLVRCFYTEEKKNRIELRQQQHNIPECLKFFGLTKEATKEDVKRAYHEAALKSHPDTSRTHEGFLKLQEYFQTALRVARPCSTAQQSVHLTLGILAKISGSFQALAFFQSDGFAVPAPAQVTQTVRPFVNVLGVLEPAEYRQKDL